MIDFSPCCPPASSHPLAHPPARSLPPSAEIIAIAAESVGVPLPELLGRSREHRTVQARVLAACLLRLYRESSYPEMARALHRNNHSSVWCMVNRTQRRPGFTACALHAIHQIEATIDIRGAARAAIAARVPSDPPSAPKGPNP